MKLAEMKEVARADFRAGRLSPLAFLIILAILNALEKETACGFS